MFLRCRQKTFSSRAKKVVICGGDGIVPAKESVAKLKTTTSGDLFE